MLKHVLTRFLSCVCVAWVCGGHASISIAGGVGYPFTFEVRVSKTAAYDIKQTRVIYVASHWVRAGNLWAYKQREEGGFLVFQSGLLLALEDEPRRGLIVRAYPAPSQVFLLSIPRTPKPQDWSQWQRPSYIEAGNSLDTFFKPDSQVPSRSTNVPPVSFEVRYKIGPKRIE